MLYETPVSARERFVAHAVREIRNRLPERITGEKRKRVDYEGHLKQLIGLCEQHGLSLDDVRPIAPTESSEEAGLPEEMSLPEGVRVKFVEMVRDHTEGSERLRESIVRMFAEAAPENQEYRETIRPVAERWFETTKWFMERTHAPEKLNSASLEELLLQFELFEKGLMSLANAFYETIDELDEILGHTHS
jgi:hypothetical protein